MSEALPNSRNLSAVGVCNGDCAGRDLVRTAREIGISFGDQP